MRIYFQPIRSDRKVTYEATGEVLTVTMDGFSDVFDFSNLKENEYLMNLTTKLPINPIRSARKVGGIVEVIVEQYVEKDTMILVPEEVET